MGYGYIEFFLFSALNPKRSPAANLMFVVAWPCLVEVNGSPVPSLLRGVSSLADSARRPSGLRSNSGVNGGRGLVDGSADVGWPPPSTRGGRPNPSDALTAGWCLGGRSE
jgi:hypothetical protein